MKEKRNQELSDESKERTDTVTVINWQKVICQNLDYFNGRFTLTCNVQDSSYHI